MRPIDRGIVALESNSDGSANIYICAEVEDGRPIDVFAQHVGVSSDALQVEVPMQQAGSVSYTKRVVEVASTDAGDVHIRPVPVAAGS